MIDALKAQRPTTIWRARIPITDFGRMAHRGIRVISFRHEQNAGNAACRRLPDQETRRLPHGVSAGSQRPDRAGARHHQLLSDDPDLGFVRAQIVDLQQGDYERWISSPLRSRCARQRFALHAADIGIGLARAIRAAVSGRRAGTSRSAGEASAR
jgi:oxalyl-CoA decarboxylase